MSNIDNGGNGSSGKVPGRERPASLARRFYKAASFEAQGAALAILLDGRGIKTPRKRALLVPTRGLAAAIAGEWDAQSEVINPALMPLTRFANTAIDAVAGNMDAVAQDIAHFAASDLLCYRAEGPDGLVARQHALWDPLIDWARDELGAGLSVTTGIAHVPQPEDALRSIRGALGGFDAFRLTSLHVMTTLTGSAVLALAAAHGRLAAADAWSAAHVDEDWQIEHWGRDAEAERRRAARLAEFEAAVRFLTLSI